MLGQLHRNHWACGGLLIYQSEVAGYYEIGIERAHLFAIEKVGSCTLLGGNTKPKGAWEQLSWDQQTLSQAPVTDTIT